LAEYRLQRFISDNTPTTPPFYPTTSEGEIIHIAKEQAVEKVLAIDQALGKSSENPLKET
jgi:hypothetical protein